jgi:cellulose synthase/poly-beta-1,6-N-acetylglucosamine synthase-like glycosyltransferase
MSFREALLLSLGAYVSVNTLSALSAWHRVNSLEPPSKPPCKVSVVVPAWHEPDHLLFASLSSLRSQTVVRAYPSSFDFILVGCDGVNLSIPRRLGFRVLCSSRGKLRARHLGIEASEGEIIVASDADSFYPPNWLNLILKPFYQPDVVAVSTPTWFGALEPLIQIPKNLHYSKRLSGRASAFLKKVYYLSGGFNLSVDDVYEKTRDIKILVEEEEFHFFNRLKRFGKIVFINAPVIHLGHKTGRGLYA